MGAIAKKHLQKALNSYMKDDGATEIGAFRDAVTDILHLAYVGRDKGPDVPDFLRHWITSSGFDTFIEEIEEAEETAMHSIPDSDLPLHSVQEFKFDRTKVAFEDRLKNGSRV